MFFSGAKKAQEIGLVNEENTHDVTGELQPVVGFENEKVFEINFTNITLRWRSG